MSKLNNKIVFIFMAATLIMLIVIGTVLSRPDYTPAEKYMKKSFPYVKYETMDLIDASEYKDYRLEIYSFNGMQGGNIIGFLLQKDDEGEFEIVEASSLINGFESHYIFTNYDDILNRTIVCIIADESVSKVEISASGKSDIFDLDKHKLGGYIFEVQSSAVSFRFYDE